MFDPIPSTSNANTSHHRNEDNQNQTLPTLYKIYTTASGTKKRRRSGSRRSVGVTSAAAGKTKVTGKVFAELNKCSEIEILTLYV